MARPSSRGVTADHKATLLVQELKRFRMNVTGISENKWFGHVVYEVEGYTIFHSGGPIPHVQIACSGLSFFIIH